MSVVYVLLPIAFLFGAAWVAAFVWCVRDGQLDEVDGPPQRILRD
jgi:cbb3-type cytochrome oxidase maturation protein